MKKKKPLLRLDLVAATAALVIISIVIYYLGKAKLSRYLVSKQENVVTTGAVTVSPGDDTYGKMSGKCSRYGESKQNKFLVSYKVKSGDTLLSIVKNQVGNPSRVNEVIQLNKGNFPELSINKPFLEKDWVLYLPPKYIASSNGLLSEWNVEITRIDIQSKEWFLRSPGKFSAKIINNDTKFLSNKSYPEYKVGDCIKILVEGNNDYALAVTPQ